MMQLDKLEEILGYKFNNKALLHQAITHSSYANEIADGSVKDSERLEFLGDAVLDMVVSNVLFNQEMDKAEGDLTKLRAQIVCEKSLAAISREKGFGDFILLGKGEEHNGGRKRDSILADSVESIIGAIYIDSGFTAAAGVVTSLFEKTIEEAMAGKMPRDSKTELQERLQAHGPCTIEYKLESEDGPDHDKCFTFSVNVNGKQIGIGKGKSKKAAQASAAEAALKGL
ncbi:MAG: ribonuclease III [Bacillota bacterium]|nr:ribonuclease III [Bacillota bacterium]